VLPPAGGLVAKRTAQDPQPGKPLEPLLATLLATGRAVAWNLALHDWWGKRLEQPLWRLLGSGAPRPAVPTSITPARLPQKRCSPGLERWGPAAGPSLRFAFKLGNWRPDGPGHDRALVRQVGQAPWRARMAGSQAELQVDANGGWDLATAWSTDFPGWPIAGGGAGEQFRCPPWPNR